MYVRDISGNGYVTVGIILPTTDNRKARISGVWTISTLIAVRLYAVICAVDVYETVVFMGANNCKVNCKVNCKWSLRKDDNRMRVVAGGRDVLYRWFIAILWENKEREKLDCKIWNLNGV